MSRKRKTRYFYECGICGCLHPCRWNGDCRDDSARFFGDDLDKRYGAQNWESVPMEEADTWPACT